jgi:signal transduction histidine kinase
LPAELNLGGHRLVWEAIENGYGGFGVAAPDGLPPANETALRSLLQTAAALTGVRLDAEALRAEVAASLVLADVAEVASPMAHEFNNFLNALLLHVAVLELKLAPEQRQGLAEIRQLGKGMAALVQQWQNYRRRSSDGRTADLNQAARDAAAAVGEAVRLELHAEALPVAATAAELRRFCAFLLRNAVAATPPGGTVTVRTAREDGKAVLRVEDDGPALAANKLAEYFDAYPVRREGTSGLELAACKALARRLQGKISAENGAERGVTVTAQLPTGAERGVH